MEALERERRRITALTGRTCHSNSSTEQLLLHIRPGTEGTHPSRHRGRPRHKRTRMSLKRAERERGRERQKGNRKELEGKGQTEKKRE